MNRLCIKWNGAEPWCQVIFDSFNGCFFKLLCCFVDPESVMGSSPLDLYAQEYFKSLNSIAQRISTDIATTVAAYEDLWHTLSVKDQNQVVNETIIYPEVVLKYSFSQQDCLQENDSTSCNYYINEEKKRAALSTSDEHAAPFSWKTRSQLNLSVFGDNDVNVHSKPTSSSKSPQRKTRISVQEGFIDPPNIVLGGSSSKLTCSEATKAQNDAVHAELLSKIKGKAVILKIQPSKPSSQSSDCESNVTKGSGGEKQTAKISTPGAKPQKTFSSKFISKPKNPPPPPPPKQKVTQNQPVAESQRKSLQEDISNGPSMSENKENRRNLPVEDDFPESFDDFHVDINSPIKGENLPKTGFDFLDNW